MSSILSSSEVWYGVTQIELEGYEQVDKMWIKELMNCSSSVPKELLYLELAILPIRYVIQIRRLLYFHHILRQRKDSLLHKFFMAQLTNPRQRDWVSQVLQEVEDLNINLEIKDIELLSKEKYKSLIKEVVYKRAFSNLLIRKQSKTSEHAKGKEINYSEFELQDYLSPNYEDLTIEEQRWIFQCRVEYIDIKGNHHWKFQDISSFSCKKNIDETQSHLLCCEYLLGKNENMMYIPPYSELYIGDLKEQVYVARLLQENFKNRISENQ